MDGIYRANRKAHTHTSTRAHASRLKLTLAGAVNPEKCTSKVKGSRVILTLPKEKSESWSHLLECEKIAAEAKKPKVRA